MIDTAWWFQPLWKIWKSVGMMTFPIYGKVKNVPNHQPVYIYIYISISQPFVFGALRCCPSATLADSLMLMLSGKQGPPWLSSSHGMKKSLDTFCLDPCMAAATIRSFLAAPWHPPRQLTRSQSSSPSTSSSWNPSCPVPKKGRAARTAPASSWLVSFYPAGPWSSCSFPRT